MNCFRSFKWCSPQRARTHSHTRFRSSMRNVVCPEFLSKTLLYFFKKHWSSLLRCFVFDVIDSMCSRISRLTTTNESLNLNTNVFRNILVSSHFYWTASHAIGAHSAVSSRTNTPNPYSGQQQQLSAQHQQLPQQFNQCSELAGTKSIPSPHILFFSLSNSTI